jgi:hypothetical protein
MHRAANALPNEPDEAPVIPNEQLESSVASIRTNLTDLRAEFRADARYASLDVRIEATKVFLRGVVK